MRYAIKKGLSGFNNTLKCIKIQGEVLGSSFAGYVPLASQNPYPIIVFFWSILWPIINSILVTFGQTIFLLSKSRKSATLF